MQNPESESTPRNNRIIVAPFDRDQYPEIVQEKRSSSVFFQYSNIPSFPNRGGNVADKQP